MTFAVLLPLSVCMASFVRIEKDERHRLVE